MAVSQEWHQIRCPQTGKLLARFLAPFPLPGVVVEFACRHCLVMMRKAGQAVHRVLHLFYFDGSSPVTLTR